MILQQGNISNVTRWCHAFKWTWRSRKVNVALDMIKGVLGNIPFFGICLGHQLFALSQGAKAFKMKFGHRGANHPVKDLRTGKVDITSQNHGYAIDKTH